MKTWIALFITVTGCAFAVDQDRNPWGIASSSSAFRDYTEWMPRMAEAGVGMVRLFPEWRGLEPTKGQWQWDKAEALIQTAADHHLTINAILMGSVPWSQEKGHTFPVNDLDDWSTYVATVVGHFKSSVHHWEVWNEGNGGFNDSHHTTQDYARLAATAYTAAKKADPAAQIGFSVASFDAPYLTETIRALPPTGGFDYLCIHPYELADGIKNADGEIPFLWMSRLLRESVRSVSPDHADAPIWITEIGRRVNHDHGREVTEQDAAESVVKLYTMALAQDIQRTQWFEARDPAGEEPGFGLLKRDGSPRASYIAFKALAQHLGPAPHYLGWLALGDLGRGYGFVFQGADAPVLIAWMPAGGTAAGLAFKDGIKVLGFNGFKATALAAGKSLALTSSPVLLQGLSSDLVNEAKSHHDQPFPWGGNYTTTKSVSLQFGTPEGHQGVYLASPNSQPLVTYPDDGKSGLLVGRDQGLRFFVHPSFASLAQREYYIRITVRRTQPGSAGMNLHYEQADTQGRMPYRNTGQWYSLSNDPGWQTHTWHVMDASFSKMWGYDFNVQPEQNVPFVIGKVEVSTVAFGE